MDVDLVGEDGASATRRITAAPPETTVVMLTPYEDTDRLLEAIRRLCRGRKHEPVSTDAESDLTGVSSRGWNSLLRASRTKRSPRNW